METIGIGNQALIYAGNDNVLKEIYEKYHGISFLTKHFQKDSEKLIAVLDGKYTKAQRNEDIENLKLDFTNENYADDYLKKLVK